MTPVQMRMARAALALSYDQLAARAGLDPRDIARLESGGEVDASTGARVQTTLEQAGIEWIDADGVRARGSVSHETIPLEQLNSYNDE